MTVSMGGFSVDIPVPPRQCWAIQDRDGLVPYYGTRPPLLFNDEDEAREHIAKHLDWWKPCEPVRVVVTVMP